VIKKYFSLFTHAANMKNPTLQKYL